MRKEDPSNIHDLTDESPAVKEEADRVREKGEYSRRNRLIEHMLSTYKENVSLQLRQEIEDRLRIEYDKRLDVERIKSSYDQLQADRDRVRTSSLEENCTSLEKKIKEQETVIQALRDEKEKIALDFAKVDGLYESLKDRGDLCPVLEDKIKEQDAAIAEIKKEKELVAIELAKVSGVQTMVEDQCAQLKKELNSRSLPLTDVSMPRAGQDELSRLSQVHEQAMADKEETIHAVREAYRQAQTIYEHSIEQLRRRTEAVGNELSVAQERLTATHEQMSVLRDENAKLSSLPLQLQSAEELITQLKDETTILKNVLREKENVLYAKDEHSASLEIRIKRMESDSSYQSDKFEEESARRRVVEEQHGALEKTVHGLQSALRDKETYISRLLQEKNNLEVQLDEGAKVMAVLKASYEEQVKKTNEALRVGAERERSIIASQDTMQRDLKDLEKVVGEQSWEITFLKKFIREEYPSREVKPVASVLPSPVEHASFPTNAVVDVKDLETLAAQQVNAGCEIKVLQNKNDIIEKDMKVQGAENESLVEMIDDKQQDIESYRKEKIQAAEKIADMEECIWELQMDDEAKKKRIVSLKAEVESLLVEKEDKDAAYVGLSSELGQLRMSYEDMLRDMDTLQQVITDATHDRLILENECMEWQERLTAAQKSYKDARDALSGTISKCHELQAAHDDLTQTMQCQNGNQDVHERMWSRYQERIDANRQILEEKEAILAKQEAEVRSMHSTITQLQEEQRKREATLVQAKARIDELESRLEKASVSCEVMKSEEHAMTSEKDHIDEEKKALEAIIESNKDRILSLEQEHEVLQKKYDKAENEKRAALEGGAALDHKTVEDYEESIEEAQLLLDVERRRTEKLLREQDRLKQCLDISRMESSDKDHDDE